MSGTDIIVVGAGHNGLVCGTYLAKAGLSVTVIDQRSDIGGCTRTIDFPDLNGWRVNTCADVDIFFHDGPVPADLELKKYGLEMLTREATYFVPFEDGTSLFLWPDLERSAKEIAKFSKHDSVAYRDYLGYWEEAFRRLSPVSLKAPPQPGELAEALGGDAWADEFLQLLVTPGDVITKSWFESPQMQGIMAWQISMYGVSPDQAGVGMGVAHLAGCVLSGIQRPKGGTGAICAAIRACLEDHGGSVVTGNGVERIIVDDARAVGVQLKDGSRIDASRAVVSSIDAKRVFLDLVEQGVLARDDQRAVERISVNNIGLFRVSLAVSETPRFDKRYGDDAAFVKNSLQASQMLCADSWETVQTTWDTVVSGEISRPANSMWIGIPTAMDSTLAPTGCHVISFAEYLPYRLNEGTWKERGQEATEIVIDTWCRYSGATRDKIVGVWTQTPEDIARETGNINSNAFHVDEAFHQMFGMRPTPRMGQYRTPVDGLYLSGSGVHPGGGITGLPGRNTAQAVLSDLGVAASQAA